MCIRTLSEDFMAEWCRSPESSVADSSGTSFDEIEVLTPTLAAHRVSRSFESYLCLSGACLKSERSRSWSMSFTRKGMGISTSRQSFFSFSPASGTWCVSFNFPLIAEGRGLVDHWIPLDSPSWFSRRFIRVKFGKGTECSGLYCSELILK